jgi:hypothetical protein
MAVGRPLHSPSYRYSQPSQILACHSETCFIRWKVTVAIYPILKENGMLSLWSIATNYHNDLHGVESYAQLTMNMREMTGLEWNTMEELAYTDKFEHVSTCF